VIFRVLAHRKVSNSTCENSQVLIVTGTCFRIGYTQITKLLTRPRRGIQLLINFITSFPRPNILVLRFASHRLLADFDEGFWFNWLPILHHGRYFNICDRTVIFVKVTVSLDLFLRSFGLFFEPISCVHSIVGISL